MVFVNNELSNGPLKVGPVGFLGECNFEWDGSGRLTLWLKSP
jgi:hypothetical protein